MSYLSRVPDEVLEKMSVCCNLSYKEYRKALRRELKLPNGDPLNVFFPEYHAEPFMTTQCPIADEILSDYLTIPATDNKKSILKRLKERMVKK